MILCGNVSFTFRHVKMNLTHDEVESKTHTTESPTELKVHFTSTAELKCVNKRFVFDLVLCLICKTEEKTNFHV